LDPTSELRKIDLLDELVLMIVSFYCMSVVGCGGGGDDDDEDGWMVMQLLVCFTHTCKLGELLILLV